MKFIIIIIFFLFFEPLIFFGQKPELELINKTFNFGEIGKEWLPPAKFIYKNTGDAQLAIVFGKLPNGITIEYSRKYVQPNDTDTIFVYYTPTKVGYFEEKIEVNSNANFNTEYITIKGLVTEVIECPKVSNPKLKPNNNFPLLIVVLDHKTGLPIIDAEISAISKYYNFDGLTNKNGNFEKNILPGNYKIAVSAKDYISVKDYKYIQKNNKTIVYKLEKNIEEIKTEKEITNPLLTSNKSEIKPTSKPIIEINEILPVNKYKANNIIFLIDVSASMKGKTKIEFLKKSVTALLEAMRDIDYISIITYNKETNIIFDAVNGSNKDELIEYVNGIYADGGTSGIIGLTKAYEICLKNIIANGNNEVYIATDGEFKSPEYSEKELMILIKGNTQLGINLSVIGFGDDNAAIKSMKKMAKTGNGTYVHINKEKQIENILIEEIKNKSIINN